MNEIVDYLGVALLPKPEPLRRRGEPVHPVAVAACLRWRDTAPLEVVGAFAGVEWVLSRDVLINGLDGPVGDGDYQLLPTLDGSYVELVLTYETTAVLRIPRGALRAYLARTTAVVALGDEHATLDYSVVTSWLVDS